MNMTNVLEMVVAIMIVIGGLWLLFWIMTAIIDNWDAILEVIVVLTVIAIIYLTLNSIQESNMKETNLLVSLVFVFGVLGYLFPCMVGIFNC